MELVESLAKIDWNDLADISLKSEQILRTLATDRAALSDAIHAVKTDTRLVEMCEHYDLLDKLVLYDHEDLGVRIRLHVFLPGHFDRPHNHRWTYSSLILRGSYRHVLYGQDQAVGHIDAAITLPQLMVRTEREGMFYTLHHSMIHAVEAEPYTISLVLRGPSVKHRFFVVDRVQRSAWWQYGASQEAATLRAEKQMSQERLDTTIRLLSDYGIAA